MVKKKISIIMIYAKINSFDINLGNTRAFFYSGQEQFLVLKLYRSTLN
jgi:hypothetical protein